MYSKKDMVMDVVGGALLSVAFILLWCAGAIMDLTTVGF